MEPYVPSYSLTPLPVRFQLFVGPCTLESCLTAPRTPVLVMLGGVRRFRFPTRLAGAWVLEGEGPERFENETEYSSVREPRRGLIEDLYAARIRAEPKSAQFGLAWRRLQGDQVRGAGYLERCVVENEYFEVGLETNLFANANGTCGAVRLLTRDEMNTVFRACAG